MSGSGILYCLKRSFDDFDDCAAGVRQWNLDLQQIDRGPFFANVLQFGTQDAHISEARFGRKLTQTGAPPAGLRTFAIPASCDIGFFWRGHQVSGRNLLAFPPGGELNAISSPDFHVYTCSFAEETLAGIWADLYPGSDMDGLLKAEVFRCSGSRLSEVRQCLRDMCNMMNTGAPASGLERLAVASRTRLPWLILLAIAWLLLFDWAFYVFRILF